MRLRWPLAIIMIFCFEFVYASIEVRKANKLTFVNNTVSDNDNRVTTSVLEIASIQFSCPKVSSQHFINIDETEPDDFIVHQKLKNNKKHSVLNNINNSFKVFSDSTTYYKSPSGCHLCDGTFSLIKLPFFLINSLAIPANQAINVNSLV